MGSITRWGYAQDALYTLHPAHRVGEVIGLDGDQIVEGPWVLGLWTGAGDGIALEGTSTELLHYLRLAIAHVEQLTRQEGLPAVLDELADVRSRRDEVLTADPADEDLDSTAHYDTRELQLLRWIAGATSELLDHRP